MAQPPNLNYQVVSADEMKRLVGQHKIEEKLPSCAQQRSRQEQSQNHEQFCCKKDLVLFTDSSTNDEVALVVEQVHAEAAKGTTRATPPGSSRRVRRRPLARSGWRKRPITIR